MDELTMRVDIALIRQVDTPLACLTDDEIVARVRAGERGLFELLMRRHNARLFRAARAILRHDDEAEDVMQEAYVRAYEHLGSFRGESSFATWLTRIAVHEALARMRRLRRERALASADPPAEHVVPLARSPNPEEHSSDAELRVLLERAIDALPTDFRLAFVLRTIEQMSAAEAAAVLGIPESTVTTRLFRARARLRRDLRSAFEADIAAAYSFHASRCDRVVAVVLAKLAAAG